MNEKEKEIRKLLNVADDVDCLVLDLTPDQARGLLVYNLNNRKINRDTVNRYKTAIVNDMWELTNDSVSISPDGFVSNGQHRLTAISECDKPCKIGVVFGVAQNYAIDCGRARSTYDNIKLASNFDADLKGNLTLQKIMSQVPNICMGYSQKKYSPEIMVGLMQFYKDELLSFDRAGLSKISSAGKGLCNATITAAMFVAYMNGVDKGVLLHIKTVLESGITTDVYDAPIIALRDNLATIKGGGREAVIERATRTMYCIRSCVKGNKGKRNKCGDWCYSYDFIGNYAKANGLKIF